MRLIAILLLLSTVPAFAQDKGAEPNANMEQILRLNASIDPLIQQRDSGLNALAICQGDMKTMQGKLAAAEAAAKAKSDKPADQ